MTELERLSLRAEAALEGLRTNAYPGRGILVGLDPTGAHVVQMCWIMGRSPGSRNRVYEEGDEPGLVRTAVAVPSQPSGDPALTIYNTMRSDFQHGRHVVSNGHQTDDVVSRNFLAALQSWAYEPDAPNFTPRITAKVEAAPSYPVSAQIMVQRKSAFDDSCEQHFYLYPSLPRGVGWCVTTYMGDGKPLPAFSGEPFPLPVFTELDHNVKALWGALDEGNRVSLAVKRIEIATGKIEIQLENKYEKVPTPA